MKPGFSRREILAGAIAAVGAPSSVAFAQEAPVEALARRNISSFRTHRWQDHFDDLSGGVILSGTRSRMLQYGSEDGTITRVYPASVPMSDDPARLGYTRVIRKVEGPSRRPTPSMKARNPEWPDYVGPGPENPLGTHALYLSWQYCRVHGTNDTCKIGRRRSNGCIGLYNEQIEELYALARVGTQVKLIGGAGR